MRNNLLTSPIGFDYEVQRIQEKMYSFISNRWSGTLDGYGKAYKNIDKDGSFVYEWWNGAKQDYEDVYYNDSSSDAVFFFIEPDTAVTEDNIAFSSTAKMVVMCNLKKTVSVSSNERRDQQAHRDIVEGLRSANIITIESIETDIDTIFSGVETKHIKFKNIHPLHCFSVNFLLNYYLNNKCD